MGKLGFGAYPIGYVDLGCNRLRVKLVAPGRQEALANAGVLIRAMWGQTGTDGGELHVHVD